MTNRELFTTVRPTIQVLGNGTTPESNVQFPGAQTTSVRYAVVKNEREFNDCIQVFQDELADIAEDTDHSAEDLLEWVNGLLFAAETEVEISDDVEEEIVDLLDKDIPFDAYTITEADLKQEPSLPIEILHMMEDFMVNGET